MAALNFVADMPPFLLSFRAPGWQAEKKEKWTSIVNEQLHESRKSKRRKVMLPTQCRSVSGFLDRGVINDITPEGCRFESKALTLHRGDLVVVRPEGVEGLSGRVRWVNRYVVGIEFLDRLYEPVVDHLYERHNQFPCGQHEAETDNARRTVRSVPTHSEDWKRRSATSTFQ